MTGKIPQGHKPHRNSWPYVIGALVTLAMQSGWAA
jgi:hypothetical protein